MIDIELLNNIPVKLEFGSFFNQYFSTVI